MSGTSLRELEHEAAVDGYLELEHVDVATAIAALWGQPIAADLFNVPRLGVRTIAVEGVDVDELDRHHELAGAVVADVDVDELDRHHAIALEDGRPRELEGPGRAPRAARADWFDRLLEDEDQGPDEIASVLTFLRGELVEPVAIGVDRWA